jgi:hypothetical protein
MNPLSYFADVALSAGNADVSDADKSSILLLEHIPDSQASVGTGEASQSSLAQFNAKLRNQIQELKAQLESPTYRFMFSHFANDTEKVDFFTGLMDKDTFRVFRDLLAQFPLNYHGE